jgi:hypothetical protein
MDSTLDENLKLVSRKDEKAAKNGEKIRFIVNFKTYRHFFARFASQCGPLLGHCEKMLCFVPACPGSGGSSWVR